MISNTIKFNNSTIEYSTTGAGKAIVFIHGFAEDNTIWQHQITHLQNQFQLILPNLPGAGASAILKQNKVQINDYAAIINAILIQLQIDEAIIVGHSLGGYVALAFAELYPTKITALGLIHSTSYGDSEEKKATRKKSMEFITEHGSAAFVKTIYENLFFEAIKHKKDIDNLVEKGSKFSPDALVQYYNAMINRASRTNVLQSFTKPVLFIIGQHDKVIPFTESLAQTHMPALAYIHILRSSGHMGMLEEIELLNTYLFNFFEHNKP